MMFKGFIEKHWVYFAATLMFLVVIFFMAKITVVNVWQIKRNISRMKAETEEYREQSKADSLFLEQLKDDEFLEKYAREKFYLKRHGEEIYVIDED